MSVSTSPSVHEGNAKNRPYLVILVAVLAIAFLAGFAGSAPAPNAPGTIKGTVTDPKGLAVEGADVSIKNTDTGSDTPAMTNDVGRYVVPLLQSGHYEVSV